VAAGGFILVVGMDSAASDEQWRTRRAGDKMKRSSIAALVLLLLAAPALSPAQTTRNSHDRNHLHVVAAGTSPRRRPVAGPTAGTFCLLAATGTAGINAITFNRTDNGGPPRSSPAPPTPTPPRLRFSGVRRLARDGIRSAQYRPWSGRPERWRHPAARSRLRRGAFGPFGSTSTRRPANPTPTMCRSTSTMRWCQGRCGAVPCWQAVPGSTAHIVVRPAEDSPTWSMTLTPAGGFPRTPHELRRGRACSRTKAEPTSPSEVVRPTTADHDLANIQTRYTAGSRRAGEWAAS
jgi:hypothetical protein